MSPRRYAANLDPRRDSAGLLARLASFLEPICAVGSQLRACVIGTASVVTRANTNNANGIFTKVWCYRIGQTVSDVSFPVYFGGDAGRIGHFPIVDGGSILKFYRVQIARTRYWYATVYAGIGCEGGKKYRAV